MKVVVFYPYDTGDRAFSGGVAKVAVSNVMAVHMNGDKPYLLLPKGNTGLINYVKEHCPYCEIAALDFQIPALFSDTKNKLVRLKLILNNLVKFYFGRSSVKNYLQHLRPDVIHFHETISYPFVKYGKGAKCVVHIHSYQRMNQFILNKIVKALNNYAQVVISPTKSIKEQMQPMLNANIRIVTTPYLNLSDSKQIEPFEELERIKASGKLIFSYVGRICRIKRIECCLKAMAKLTEEERARMVYVIIGGCNTEGDKDYKKELDEIISANNLSESVNYIGYVNPIEKALPYIDYGVMLTKSEAMPMVGIEYMRFNIPTIGFDAPGINDFVETGKTGYLVKNGDVDELTKTFRGILNGENVYDFKNTIPPVFSNYSIDAFAKTIDLLYKK
jgi:glycosyltransferase involved in cell wall biosynthesis